MDYLLVAIGGAAGSTVRYLLGRKIAERSRFEWPVGTLVINVSGAFLLGLLSFLKVNPSSFTLLGDGFLGAYTTFSTFMYEGFRLFEDKENLNALVYIAGSLVLGITGFLAGAFVAKLII